jgi:hypothetical protein
LRVSSTPAVREQIQLGILGASLVYVKDQLGHASIKITVDTYGHLIPGANKAAVDRLDVTGRNPTATEGGTTNGEASRNL